jgi:hypothetical protein
MINTHMANKEDLTEVNARPGKIEHLLMEDQKRDIADVKARVKRLGDALSV